MNEPIDIEVENEVDIRRMVKEILEEVNFELAYTVECLQRVIL